MKLKATIPVNMMLLDGITLNKRWKTSLLGTEREIPVSIAITFNLNPEHLAVARNAEILGDDKGVKGNTSVVVNLELSAEDEQQIRNMHITNQIFIDAVNDLIDAYRLRTNREWVERISLNHITQINTEYEHSRNFSIAGFPSVASQNPSVRTELIQKVKDAYESSKPIPIFIEYYLLSKKYCEGGRYDLSIVFSNIALESFLFLFSKLVHGAEHDRLILPTTCEHCHQQKFKTLRDIFESIGSHITLDTEQIFSLIRSIKRPNGNAVRNDITHGKIVFLGAASAHKADAELALNSVREIFEISIRAYPTLKDYL